MSAGALQDVDTLRPRVERWRNLALIVGGASLAVCLVVGLIPGSREPMMYSYLVGYVFWFGIALGGVALTMLHHLTGGAWGLVIRRPLEAAAMTLVPLAVLFVPILLGMHSLYRWTDHEFVEHHMAVAHKQAYLNPTWFSIRTAGYFALWILFALLLNLWSGRQDRAKDRAPSRWLQTLSGPGLGLVFLSTTFAAVDWMMSLEPDWVSTIYGPMLICGWGLATFSAMTIVGSFLSRFRPMDRFARPVQFNDLGNLMLAFTMLWAYTSFMQFLIIWCGNLAEEIPWYLRRTRGGWQLFALALIVFHFFAPFFVLLARDLKRRPEVLLRVAAGILVLHLIDTTWLILPAQFEDPLGTVYVPFLQLLLVLLATAGVGGIWVATFLWRLQGRPVVPVNDPAVDHLDHDHEPHGQGA